MQGALASTLIFAVKVDQLIAYLVSDTFRHLPLGLLPHFDILTVETRHRQYSQIVRSLLKLFPLIVALKFIRV